jgi:multiple sugar transport system ATP-binding protein
MAKKDHTQNVENKVEQTKNEEVVTVPADAYISLVNINKVYDNGYHAVHDFNLNIKKHEFIVFVGPSGCGKSTSLRMIAGLEDITSGHLFIDGERVNNLSPRERNIAMVFQSYALYPHMTVFNNMAYSLKISKFFIKGLTEDEEKEYKKKLENLDHDIEVNKNKFDVLSNLKVEREKVVNQYAELANKDRLVKLTRKQIHERVLNAAKILQIEDLLDRKPKALSGGQRQRVALGRAIVRNAKVFLMDEPLSNLDAKLRVQMRSEIVKLHKQINATTIYVTHDQTEAMTMASRIVIMKDGYVHQVGTPLDIFNHPVNKFVASFIGSPAMNFFNVNYDGKNIIFENGKSIKLPVGYEKTHNLKPKMIMGIRPEHIYDGESNLAEQYKDATLDIVVDLTELLGSEYYVHNNFGGLKFVSKQEALGIINIGEKRKVIFNTDRLHFFDVETEEAL